MSTVKFLGETFAVADRIGALPFMRFAKVAREGVDSSDLDGMSAMYDLLEQCIAENDWHRFERHADKQRADGDQLLQVVRDVFKVLSERPTGRSSDSSAGPRTIEPNSTVASSSPVSERVIARFNEQGRPDLALLTRKRQESLSA